MPFEIRLRVEGSNPSTATDPDVTQTLRDVGGRLWTSPPDVLYIRTMSTKKSAEALPSVRIDVPIDDHVVREQAEVKPLTMGEILASLPFSGTVIQPLCADPLPFDDLPQVVFPK